MAENNTARLLDSIIESERSAQQSVLQPVVSASGLRDTLGYIERVSGRRLVPDEWLTPEQIGEYPGCGPAATLAVPFETDVLLAALRRVPPQSVTTLERHEYATTTPSRASLCRELAVNSAYQRELFSGAHAPASAFRKPLRALGLGSAR